MSWHTFILQWTFLFQPSLSRALCWQSEVTVTPLSTTLLTHRTALNKTVPASKQTEALFGYFDSQRCWPMEYHSTIEAQQLFSDCYSTRRVQYWFECRSVKSLVSKSSQVFSCIEPWRRGTGVVYEMFWYLFQQLKLSSILYISLNMLLIALTQKSTVLAELSNGHTP